MALTIEGYTHITHKLSQRSWGPEVRFTFADAAGVHSNEVLSVPSMDVTNRQLIDIITPFLARIKAAQDREAALVKIFSNLGPEVKEAIFWLIRKIRQYPNATYAQAETAWNAEWADSLFTFAKLATYVQRLTGDVTWAQFKTYVINHEFEGLD